MYCCIRDPRYVIMNAFDKDKKENGKQYVNRMGR